MSEQVRKTCRCCESTNLEKVLDLGQQPLANSYTTEPKGLDTYPLELMVCRDCFHNQLSIVVNPDEMFRHYLYVSGTSRTLRQHFEELAKEACERANLGHPRVLDLASNDGTLLEAFNKRGAITTGVDPAGNLIQLAREKYLHVIDGYWPQVKEVIAGWEFDIITACNVLAHVDSPKDFLFAALAHLDEDGEIIVEFPYCKEMIRNCEFDTIYHEHLSYFLVGPFLKLLESIGAYAHDIKTVPIHGGSLRIFIKKGDPTHCDKALAMVGFEVSQLLYQMTTYFTFRERVTNNCRSLRELVWKLVSEGQKVIGYGASAKGNTLLNYTMLPLFYIVDDNPLKHGYFTPGQKILIRPLSEVENEEQNLNVVLLAWNFAREIKENWSKLRAGEGDYFIQYVPSVSRGPF